MQARSTLKGGPVAQRGYPLGRDSVGLERRAGGTGKQELDPVTFDAKMLTRLLLDAFADPSYAPPRLPRVALQIMELGGRPEAGPEDALKLLESDPLLSGRVLSSANSAAFRPARPLTSLRECVVRLGVRGVRDVVLGEALDMRVFRAEGFRPIMEALRLHSQACARIAQIAARVTRVEADTAFLLGLMHDIGHAGALVVLGERFTSSNAAVCDMVSQIIDDEHERTGAHMCRIWGMPEGFVRAIAEHHQWNRGAPPPLDRALIVVADTMASELGFPGFGGCKTMRGQAKPDAQDLEATEIARAALRLDDRLWKLLRGHAEEAVSDLAEPPS